MRTYEPNKYLSLLLSQSAHNWVSEQHDYIMMRLRMRASKAMNRSVVELLMAEINLSCE